MKLKEYFAINKVNRRALAKIMGCSTGTISSYEHEERTPSLVNALQLYSFTHGTVRLEDMLCVKDREKIEKVVTFSKKSRNPEDFL